LKAKAPLRSKRNLTKERYLERLHELARDYYSLGHGKSYAKTKAESHLNGYLLAGTHTRLADPDELSSILEELHYEEFGYSIEDGKTLTKLGATEPEDWRRFEEPTFMRYSKGIAIKRRRSRGSNHD
jgi:hypothetical protein